MKTFTAVLIILSLSILAQSMLMEEIQQEGK